MEQWTVGDVTITKIEEFSGWTTIEEWARTMPDCTLAAVDEVTWLRPTYRHDDTINLSVHALLVQTPDRKIVVDLGVGNGKQRGWEVGNELDTDFLERFEQVWSRDEVDLVVFTHLHTDHVGWSTVPVDGGWAPTFPNARYCYVREEHDYWTRYAAEPEVRATYDDYAQHILDGPAVYEDSIKPVVDAGLVDWVEPGDTIAPGVTLVGTPGHTPGHVSVLVESGDASAVITGDVFHSPAQVTRSDWTVLMDSAPEVAVDSRQGLLERVADTDTLVIGSHFGAPSGNYVRRDGESYRLVPPDDLDGADRKQGSITIDAGPDEVYAVVSDVTRTGEWSPVCTACWWTDEDGEPTDAPEGGPVAGTWFAGRNEIPGRTWETRSLVLEAEPGRAFRWQIYGRLVTWGYQLAPQGDGTLLTETWDLNQATKDMFAEKYGDRAEEVLDGRRRDAQEGIPATLRAIKQIVEGGQPAAS